MSIIETTYTITLTPAEIEIITTALHGQYKTGKELMETATPDQIPGLTRRTDEARTLRNTFGKLINRSYMGIDA